MTRFIRFVLSLTATITPMFAGAIAAARALPQESPLRDLLEPKCDTVAACFLGIYPGVTTIDEALAHLQANPRIKDVVMEERSPFKYIHWEWNGDPPGFAEPPASGSPPYIWVQNEDILFIRIPTGIHLGDVQLMLGLARYGAFAISGTYSASLGERFLIFHQTSGYFSNQLVVESETLCPISPRMFYGAPVTLTVYGPYSSREFVLEPNEFRRWMYGKPCQF